MIKLKPGRNGFTLIEMMISLAIGSIVTFTGLTLYAQMSKSSSIVRAESLLQENDYFIQQTLRQYINQAGYRPQKMMTTTAVLPPIDTKEQAFPAVSGSWQAGEYIRATDDGITIRFKGASNADGSADGSIINCQRTAIDESTVVELSILVKNETLVCNSENADVTLIDENDGLDIEQYAVSFGVDTNNDESVDEYLDAASITSTNNSILAVRLSYLLSSVNDVLSQSKDYTFNNTSYTPTDKKLRHDTNLWVELKN